MWCQACRQDVPSLPSRAEGGFRCGRCGGRVAADPAPADAAPLDQDVELDDAEKPSSPAICLRPPLDLDDWETEDQLRAAERALRRFGHGAGGNAPPSIRRFDPPALRVDAVDPPQREPARPQPAPRPRRLMAALAMLALSLGLMAFACGGALMAWGWIDGRNELWNLGTPIALAGQCVMLLGLLLQLERLWRSGGDTTNQLKRVDEQLRDLERSAQLQNAAGAGSAHAFYAHLNQRG